MSPPFILDYGHIIGIGQKTSGNRTSLIIHTSQTIRQTISYIAGITQESLTGITELRFIRFVRPCSRWRLLEPIIREIRAACVPKKVRIWKRSSAPRTLLIDPRHRIRHRGANLLPDSHRFRIHAAQYRLSDMPHHRPAQTVQFLILHHPARCGSDTGRKFSKGKIEGRAENFSSYICPVLSSSTNP